MHNVKKSTFILNTVLFTGFCAMLFLADEAAAQTYLDINTGETQDGLVISAENEYNVLNINSNGEATNTTANEGGAINVNSGGTATTTTINSGGVINVNAGGTANGVTVNEAGVINATGSGATVDDLEMAENSTFNFSTDATITSATYNGQNLGSIESNAAQDFAINNGSTLTVNSNGSATNTNVSGGNLIVSGGTANTTTVGNDGVVTIENSGSADGVTVTGSGNINVASGELKNANLTGTNQTTVSSVVVDNGGSADTTTLNNYSNMTINSGGEATNTNVNNNATLNINGGSANTTTIANGGVINATVAGSTIDGITIEDGGTYNISTNATVSGGSFSGGTLDGTNLGTITDNAAQDFVINNGSTLTVNSNATATGTIVEDGGTINATESGATLNNTTINNGGNFNFSTDITLNDLNGNIITTIKDNVASGFYVGEGSTLTASDGGTITTSAVSGGTVVVESGGNITETSIGDNGTLVATESGATVGEYVNIISDTGGKFDLSTNATVTGLNYNGQNIIIENNKTESFTIGNGSRLSVDANGSSDNIVVGAGGNLTVNSNGTATNTSVSSGGEMNIDGGQAQSLEVSGTVNATNGAILSENTIMTGGIVNLNSQAIADITNINENGTLNVGGQGIANNTTVDGVMNVQAQGNADTLSINSGGEVNVENLGNISNTTLNENGTLNAAANSNVNNLTANASSVLNIEAGANITGSLAIDKNTNASGSSFDFSTLLGADNNTLTNLSLTNGVNEIFNNLVNLSTIDKNLTLSDGNYTISDSGEAGVVQVSGWNSINLTNATVRLESDLAMNGTEKNFIINSGATLDVSGTLDNILNVSLDGNVVNSGTIDLTYQGSNSYQDVLNITGNYTGNPGSMLILDINPKENGADKLVVDGNVSGSTGVYLKSSSSALPGGNILFAEANSGEASAFNIWRVEGSPYSWNTLFENNKWYGYVTDGDNPGIVPEIAAYYGLIDNMFMQTASLGANLRNNIVENEFRKVPCNMSGNLKYTNRICRSSRPVFTGWAAPVYNSITVDSPYNYTANISGVDAGLDLVGDGATKFGILGSYRSGQYTYDENGENYTITGEAENNINSYLAGVYFRHDRSNWSIIGAVYAGMLDVDISTNDGVSADTSGSTYGATLDISYIYQNIDGFRIEPGVRISYTSVSIDEVEDNAGKVREFDDGSRNEVEAGIKLAKRWNFNDAKAEIFIRPAVVQTINSANDFELVDERFMEATEDRTLAKVEAGMSFDMIGNWSASVGGAYTFGDGYTNTAANLNLRYNF